MHLKAALLAGFASALLTAALPVLAAPGPMRAPPPPITFAQITDAAARAWDRLDANHDGRIDAADRDARLLERFAQWDTNHDGMISKDEFLAEMHAREAKWHDQMPGQPQDKMHEGRREHGDQGGPGKHPGGLVEMMIIGGAMHDARQNGVVTRAAFDAAVKARFDAIDTNHDGTLGRDELRAARSHGGAERNGPREWRHDQDDLAPPPAPTPPPSPPGGAGQ